MIRALLAVAFALLLPAAAAAADLELDAASGFIIDATINGQPVRLRVDPDAPGYVVLNPAAVERIGLRRSLMGVRARIGPVRIRGHSKSAEVAVGGVTGDRRVIWFEADIVAGADGQINPADLPYDRVTWTLSPAQANETAIVLPMTRSRGSGGLIFSFSVGAQNVTAIFALSDRDSMATAAAGAAIAEAHGGTWSGEAASRPIRLGVLRPVRPLGLARPLDVSGLRFSGLLVRTGDHRGDLSLPPEPDADPDEVTVTGGSRQAALFGLSIGMDVLGRCSSLSWDNRARQMTLRCAP